jgi:hypothetical protein
MKTLIYLMVAVLFISGIIGAGVGCGGSKESVVTEKMVLVRGMCKHPHNPAFMCRSEFWDTQPNREVASENNWAYLFCEDTQEGYNVGSVTDEDLDQDPELHSAITVLFGSRADECECAMQLDETAWEWLQDNPSQYCDMEFESFIELEVE